LERKEKTSWQWREEKGIRYLFCPALEAEGLIKHGFTSRHGGVSGGSYATLNLGLHVGDNPAHVLKNRSCLAELLGVPLEYFAVAEQVHGIKVQAVKEEHRGAGAREMATALAGADALITSVQGVPLLTFHADCAALFFLDPKKRAIGLAHAGWKGSAGKIGVAVLKAMQATFGTSPGDCLVWISPAVGPCCYEVDRPVIEAVCHSFPETYRRALISAVSGQGREAERARLDLWEVNRMALAAAGVRPEYIYIASLCTSCNEDDFFSYRRMKGKPTGRMGAFVMLLP